MFQTQSEARRFFIDKIVQQARAERIDLSGDEREMLSWSEVEPDSVADPELERYAIRCSDIRSADLQVCLSHTLAGLKACATEK